MRILLLAIVLALAGASEQSIDIRMVTSGDVSLITTESNSSKSYAVVNMKDRSYVAVTLNGQNVIETQEDCSRVYKSIKGMSEEERNEIIGLVYGVDEEFRVPIKMSSGTKYLLRATFDISRISERWQLSTYGLPVVEDFFEEVECLVELHDNNITISGYPMVIGNSIARLIIVGEIAVKVLVDGSLDAKPLHCFSGDEGEKLRIVYSKITEVRTKRRNLRSTLISQVQSMNERQLDETRKLLETELEKSRKRYESKFRLFDWPIKDLEHTTKDIQQPTPVAGHAPEPEELAAAYSLVNELARQVSDPTNLASTSRAPQQSGSDSQQTSSSSSSDGNSSTQHTL